MRKKNILFAFVILFAFCSKAQEINKKNLLQGFDEIKTRKELKENGLNPDEFIESMKRRYMAGKAKELGLLAKLYQASVQEPEGQLQSRQGNANHTVYTSSCPNSGFEQLNFSGWSGITGTVNANNTWTLSLSSSATGIATLTPVNAPLAENGCSGGFNGFGSVVRNGFLCLNQIPTKNRHNIMNTPPTNNNPASPAFSGYDSLAINPTTHLAEIPLVSPNGSGTSLRLGNANGGGEMESITYSITVTSATSLFTYQYAIVLNNPQGSHSPDQQPYFNIVALDQNGNQVGGACGKYIVNTDQALSDTSYIYNDGDTYNQYQQVYYKKWTTVSVDLSAYLGQTVTITFSTHDCAYSAHYGYAYIDAYCGAKASAGSVVGFCGGTTGSVTLNSPPGYVSWQWEGPNSQTPISGATLQSYTTNNAHVNDTFYVVATSASGCTSTFELVVTPSTIHPIPGSVSTCYGGNLGTAYISVLNGGSYSYSWSGSSGSIGTTDTITNLAAGTYTVHIVDNSGSCPPKDTTVVIQSTHAPLQTTSAPICGTTGTLMSPHSTGGYMWYDNSNVLTSVTTQTYAVTNGANGQYYTVTYLDSVTHCQDSLRINLSVTNITFNASPLPSCPSGNTGSITYYPSSGNTYASFNWVCSNGNSGSNTAPPVNISNLATGVYTTTLSLPGSSGCQEVITSTVGVASPGSVPITTVSANVCNLDTLSINPGVSNSTHSWSGPGVTYPTTTSILILNTPFTNTVTSYYTYTDTITTTGSSGCTSQSIYKEVINLKSFIPKISILEGLHCFGDTTGRLKTTITNIKNGPIGNPDTYTFMWYPVSYFINNPSSQNGPSAFSTQGGNLPAGTYSCVVSNGNCVYTATTTIAQGTVTPTHDTIQAYYCPKDSLALLVADTGKTNYVWHDGSSIVAGYTSDSIYVLTANINQYYVTYKYNGCYDTAKTIISTTIYNAFHPDETVNVFSPNGDRVNDFFYPFHQKNLNQYQIFKQAAVYELKIYDRWGKLVYETTDYSKPWDGKTKGGRDADDGTYFWITKYQSNCGSKADLEEKKGFVELRK